MRADVTRLTAAPSCSHARRARLPISLPDPRHSSWDVDGDALISKKEFRAVVEAIGFTVLSRTEFLCLSPEERKSGESGVPRSQVDALFRELDKDGAPSRTHGSTAAAPLPCALLVSPRAMGFTLCTVPGGTHGRRLRRNGVSRDEGCADATP